MKDTYVGKDLDVLYYFGDSNQPGFSINAIHLYSSASQLADFSVNEDGELIVNTIYNPASTVLNRISIDEDGYLEVNSTTAGLVTVDDGGNAIVDSAAVKTALNISGSITSRFYLPVTEGYSVDLLAVVDDSNYKATSASYSSLYKYPDCIEGISLIFKERLDYIKATIMITVSGANTYTLTRKWYNTKTIGALFEEIEVGLSQVKRSRIQAVRIRIDELSVSTANLVSMYPGLVLTFNSDRHLKNLNVHQDMPNDNGVLSGGLCLSQGTLQLDDSDKYLLKLLVMYEYRGIMGTMGRKFNDFFTNPKGELIFEDGYYPEPFPIFANVNGNLEITSELLSDFITYENGNVYADYEGAPENLINKKQHILEVYLEGHKMLYKLQVSDFQYNNTQYTASVTLEDILNRLEDIKVDELASTTYSYSIPFTDIYNAIVDKVRDSGFCLPPRGVYNNPSNAKNELQRTNLKVPYSYRCVLASNMSAKTIMEDLLSCLGLVAYIKPYYEFDWSRSGALTFNTPLFADCMLVIRPCLEDIGQVKTMIHNMYYGGSFASYLFNYDKVAYTLIDSAVIGKITRSVIKPNYISKVLGSYYGWDPLNLEFNNALETSYEIGGGNNPYLLKDNNFIFYDADTGYGTFSSNSNGGEEEPTYQYLANYMISKYLFGLDTVEFEALLSKNYGDSSGICSCVFDLAERFSIDFSGTEIPTSYEYQIISSTLQYDGELTFNIVGMQC